METRIITREYRMQKWAGIIQERQASGLTVRGWCRENGVKEKTYYYWQKKLREMACEELALRTVSPVSVAPTFTEVNLPVKAETVGAITIRFENAAVEIIGNSPSSAIEAVLRTLMHR